MSGKNGGISDVGSWTSVIGNRPRGMAIGMAGACEEKL